MRTSRDIRWLPIKAAEGREVVMNIVELVEKVAFLLTPATPNLHKTESEASAAMVRREDADSGGWAKVVWQWLQPRLETRPVAMEAVANLFSEPRNPDYQANFRTQLTTILVSDMKLASNLERFLAAIPVAQPANQALVKGNGGIAQNGGIAAGAGGVAVGGNAGNVQVWNVAPGGSVVIDSARDGGMTIDRDVVLGRYLQHIISRNRYLQLQGIRSGGRLVHIELERIYIHLRVAQRRLVSSRECLLSEEKTLAPEERARMAAEITMMTETVTFSIRKALSNYPRLVVLGDPGSGKSTLLRYLALHYARDLSTSSHQVQKMLGSAEPWRLPILLPIRQIGRFLQSRPNEGIEGHSRLIEFLLATLASERIELPKDFFDSWLNRGEAVILLDGLDEVADPDLRRRVARLVESFTQTYHQCRYVVTSRIVGYTGAMRLGESYVVTKVLDFTRDDIARFLGNWHRLIAVAQMGEGESAEIHADKQARRLLHSIDHNPRIRDLAINPLLLTVIAMVHRDRVRLPDRRAELYAEAVDVLLGAWDEAKGIQEIPILLENQPFDTGDKRLMLQDLALYMHEKNQKQIKIADLQHFLQVRFKGLTGDARLAEQIATRFIKMIEERTGLLVARDEGVYAFSHLTFQEYLTALAIAARDDYVAYTLKRASDLWWREVILLEAGYLSTQSKEKTAVLIRAIAERKEEPQPYQNLVLAAECLHDVGVSRVQGGLQQEIQRRLRENLEAPPPLFVRWFKNVGVRNWIEQRALAMEALVRTGAGFWTMPYGEPEWVRIPSGWVWIGSERGRSNEQPLHRIKLDTFFVARVPITNAQYHFFVQATKHAAPSHWQENRPPKGFESHPVIGVNWHDALAYCQWLSRETGKPITLPSEVQWERAARGNMNIDYPWGDRFEATWCNSDALGLRATTPVGLFPEGASRFGCLDMAGNVWEWTRSLMGEYPYPEQDVARRAREDLEAPGERVLRGGSFGYGPFFVRCAFRSSGNPDGRGSIVGFRVAFSFFDR
jgi:formylglycine-generating enzyme required for sulfatase activity